MRCLLLLVASAAVCRSHAEPRAPEVRVEAGALRGKWVQSQLSKRNIAAFEGIPYAEPPVGPLRFQPPVAAASWLGIKIADRVSSVCIQRDLLLHKQDIEGSEDCLYINVYAPETVSRSKPLPVMVFIHGGGFFLWSGGMFGPELLMERDVVYVSFNYRLGPLGFLSTGDEVIQGNFGMKDMVMALKWVHNNIRSFGGDPDSVTIFGESAGGAAVNLLTLSPLGKGLFHRAIAMSGSANAPWAFNVDERARKNAEKLAGLLNCPIHPSEQLRECILGKSAEDIIATDLEFSQWYGHPMLPFSVVAEPSSPGAFIDRPPSQLIPHDVPLMTGIVSDEGCVISAPLLQNPNAMKDLNGHFTKVAPMTLFLSHLPDDVQEAVSKEIRDIYFGDKSIDHIAKPQLTELYSDAYFKYSTLKTIKQHKMHTKSSVYFYQLAHLSEDRSFAVPFSGYKSNATFGMCHCDDLMYLFPLKELFSQKLSALDRAYTDFILDLFTTFATTGAPTVDSSWAEVRQADIAEYAHIPNAGELTMRQSQSTEKDRLWARIDTARGTTAPSLITNDEL